MNHTYAHAAWHLFPYVLWSFPHTGSYSYVHIHGWWHGQTPEHAMVVFLRKKNCMCSNISAASAYGVYISQFIRYSRACGSYKNSLDGGLLLTRKLLNQGFLLVKLRSSLRKFYGHHHDLCVTNDHEYVPFVGNTFQSFPHSWLITDFVTRLTRLVPLVEQELLTIRST